MNYVQILQDSLHIFRTNKLIWFFGFLSLPLTIPINSLQSVRNNPILVCIYLPVSITALIISMIAIGGLYYVIHQACLSQSASLSETWQQGKSKLFRNIGLLILSVPIVLIWGFTMRIITTKAPTSPLLWFINFVGIIFISSFYTFSLCAVMINNAKVWTAAWTSFLISINNFFRVSVITGIMYFIRLLFTGLIVSILASGLFRVELPTALTFDYPTYLKILAIPIVSWTNWMFNLILFPIEAIMLTIIYLKFTKEVSYPALTQSETTA
jgi:hypothetical protein